MKTTELMKRKFNGETYTFYLNDGVGCLGIYSKYIYCKTPANFLGYEDTVLLDKSTGIAYTLHRCLPNWILKRIENKLKQLTEKYC